MLLSEEDRLYWDWDAISLDNLLDGVIVLGTKPEKPNEQKQEIFNHKQIRIGLITTVEITINHFHIWKGIKTLILTQ